MKMAPTPGVQTVVTDKSEKNLPTGIDREKEQALPLPGSATPGGEGRDIPRFVNNTPDNGIDERPRTLGEPGEDYGHPTKYDYNTVTRRSMTAVQRLVLRYLGEDLTEGEDNGRTARWSGRRWSPGKRQRRQRGRARQKSRAYYRKNKSKIKRKQKIRRSRSSWKNSPARRRSDKLRRRQNRRRIGSEVCPHCVAERYAGSKFSPARMRGGEGGKPQRRQPMRERMDDKREYRSEAPTRRRDSNRYYKTKCKPNPKCMQRRKEYRKDPDYYKRRAPRPKAASVLTVPDIAFVVGPDMMLGYVDSISPMTGMVTYRLEGNDVAQLGSLPVEVFLRAVTLMSDEDLDAFFELVDVEIGMEAYEDLDTEGLRECAGLYGVDMESEDFKEQCFDLVGETDPDSMTPMQLDLVNDQLVVGILEGGGMPREVEEEADDLDETIPDTYDPHLYYGEVEAQKTAGQVMLYDQEPPDQEVKQPAEGADYRADSSTTYRKQPSEDSGMPPGNPGFHDLQDRDSMNPSSGKVIPSQMKQDLYEQLTYVKAAATIPEIISNCGPNLIQKSKGIQFKRKRLSPSGLSTWEVQGSGGNQYVVRVKPIRKNKRVKVVAKMPVQVSCSCEYFRWQGPEHWAKSNDYLYGRPVGTASKPVVKDPKGKHWACKHVLAVLDVARKWRVASEEDWSYDGPLSPLPDPARVAYRYRKGKVG